jgi:Zn-dependent alcohol dehydrogenase
MDSCDILRLIRTQRAGFLPINLRLTLTLTLDQINEGVRPA